jgi:hypothetical protein
MRSFDHNTLESDHHANSVLLYSKHLKEDRYPWTQYKEAFKSSDVRNVAGFRLSTLSLSMPTPPSPVWIPTHPYPP